MFVRHMRFIVYVADVLRQFKNQRPWCTPTNYVNAIYSKSRGKRVLLTVASHLIVVQFYSSLISLNRLPSFPWRNRR